MRSNNKQIEDKLQALNNQIFQLLQLGQYMRATDLAIHACNLEKQYSGENHPNFAISLNNLAEIYHKLGNYAEAESLFKRAIGILCTVYGENHPDYATGLNNLGMLYLSMGNYSAAKPRLDQALEIRHRVLGEKDAKYAESLNNLASLYIRICDYPTAKNYLEKANLILSRVLGDADPFYIINLNNQASLYRYMRDYISSEALYKKSLEILRNTQGEANLDFAAILNNLALLYTLMGNYRAAEQLHINAIDIRRDLLGEKNPIFAASLNNLGELHEAMGNRVAAEPLFRQAIEILANFCGRGSENLEKCILNLALLCAATKRETEAFELMQRLLSIEDRLIGQVFAIGSESQRMIYINNLYFILYIFISFVLQYQGILSQEATQSAFNLVLRWKCICVEAFAAQRDSILGGKYPELREQLSQLTMLRRQIAAKTLAGPGPEGSDAHEALLTKWDSLKEKWESELAYRIPEMNIERKIRTVDLKAVARAIPDETTLIEFVRTNIFNFSVIPFNENPWRAPHYIAFILAAKEIDNVKMIDLGEAEQIDQLVENFLADVAEINTSINYNKIKLSKFLIDPLLREIGECKRLLLAPDGNLLRLPFEILQTENGKQLIDEFIISYTNVGRDILHFHERFSGSPANPIVIADPDFDLCCTVEPANTEIDKLHDQKLHNLDVSDNRFDRLEGTREEGKQIASMLGVPPWLGSDALDSRIKAIHSPFILHIATHGILLDNQPLDPRMELQSIASEGSLVGGMPSQMFGPDMSNPLLRSGLALAGINTWLSGGNLPSEVEDGVLTAEDASGLDLLGTKLVVLSACETGLGKIHRSEGIFGLRRAFMLAGAKTLIISLWAVDDDETQELMIEFYQRILAGQGCADALRAAKLSVRSRNAHPYYWGAFICQGDPR